VIAALVGVRVAEPTARTGPRSAASAAPFVRAPAAPRTSIAAPSAPPPAAPASAPARRPVMSAGSATAACRLTLTSVPAGASAQVGGRSYGSTPMSAIELPCGKQQIRLHHPGIADTATFAVELTPGATRTVLVDWSSGVKSKISSW
jgi:hypothetical protein